MCSTVLIFPLAYVPDSNWHYTVHNQQPTNNILLLDWKIEKSDQSKVRQHVKPWRHTFPGTWSLLHMACGTHMVWTHEASLVHEGQLQLLHTHLMVELLTLHMAALNHVCTRFFTGETCSSIWKNIINRLSQAKHTVASDNIIINLRCSQWENVMVKMLPTLALNC